MTPRIFIYVPHKAGVPDEFTAELATAARALDATATPVAVVTGSGPALDQAAENLCSTFSEVWKMANEALAYPNAELVRQALVAVVPRGSLMLVPHDHFGMDLGPGLSIKLGAAFVSDVTAIDGLNGTSLNLVRQEFGGQFSTHVTCDISAGAVINVRPGSFSPYAGKESGAVVDRSDAMGTLASRRQYVETTMAEVGDVDITRQDILVSVGRGIQEQDNIALAEELAAALGGAVSCSRPVVDAKWLPKSRQVGTSGQTVRPKVYLACGISGAFQHLAGIKGKPLLVAINKNPKAPIFQVAEVGIVADLLEFLPLVTAKVKETSAVAGRHA